MSAECLSVSGGDVIVAVRVTPRSPRQGVDGERAGRLIVRVNAPPADGAANASVRKLLAKAFGLPASRVRIVRGETSRDKSVAFEGLNESSAAAVIAEFGPA